MIDFLKIHDPDKPGDYLVIANSEFNPALHRLFSEPLAGPTFEEYVAAGYPPERYPPEGHAAIASPGLDAWREQEAKKAADVAAATEDLGAAKDDATPPATIEGTSKKARPLRDK